MFNLKKLFKMQYNTENLSEELINAISNFADEVSVNRKGEKRNVYAQPIMEGDEFVFELPEGATDIKAIVVKHDEDTKNDVPAWSALKAQNGREVSVNQLCGRTGNGIPFDATDYDGRVKELFYTIATQPLRLRVAKVGVSQSLNPKRNNSRIISWEVL